MSIEVEIPAHFVSSGWGTPTVCTRHGEASVENKRVQFISAPPGWSYLLLLAGALPFIIVLIAIRKTVDAPAWPFCTRCGRERKTRIGIGAAIAAAAVLLMVLAASMSGDSGGGGLIFLGILLLLVGYVIAVRGGSRALQARGRVVQGGQWVQFRRAHEAFAAQAAAAQQAAAQYAQPAYAQPPYAQPGPYAQSAQHVEPGQPGPENWSM